LAIGYRNFGKTAQGSFLSDTLYMGGGRYRRCFTSNGLGQPSVDVRWQWASLQTQLVKWLGQYARYQTQFINLGSRTPCNSIDRRRTMNAGVQRTQQSWRLVQWKTV